MRRAGTLVATAVAALGLSGIAPGLALAHGHASHHATRGHHARAKHHAKARHGRILLPPPTVVRSAPSGAPAPGSEVTGSNGHWQVIDFGGPR